MTHLILIWNMTHIQLTCCQSSPIPIYPIVHMMSHVILLFVSNVPALSFKFVIFPSWLHFTLTNAVLHPYSSLLMLRFMTHIAHYDVRTTLSLHHSFSHYETAFLYIRASLAHGLDSQFQFKLSALVKVQSKLNLSNHNIRVCYIDR